MEIERKYLLKSFAVEGRSELLIQGYLSLDPEIRVRIKAEKAFLTIKSEGNLSRSEIEVEIPISKAQEMLLLTDKIITKTRYTVDRWEIDVYEGSLAGLLIAEIELESETEKVEVIPNSIIIDREVTCEKAFKNKHLATKGLPKKESL